MICKKCQTRNPNNSNHCIRCGAKFKKNSGFNYFIAFIAAASLCVVLAVVLIIHLFSDEKKAVKDDESIIPAEQPHEVASYVDYVSAKEILGRFNCADISATVTNEEQYIISFTFNGSDYKLNFSDNYKMLMYSVNAGKFTEHMLNDAVKIVEGNVTVPKAEFEDFLEVLLYPSSSPESVGIAQADSVIFQ